MSVRMKLTHSKTASRRAHHRTGAPRLVATPAGVRRRHFVDPATGMYRGKQIITIGSEAEVRSKKDQAVEASEQKKVKKAAPETKKDKEAK